MMGFAVNGREPRSPEKPSVLLTGATGYIGGRLAGDGGCRRGPSRPASLDRALTGIDVAYCLVHSRGAHGDYGQTDRIAARHFGEAARRAGTLAESCTSVASRWATRYSAM
jgi:uncharacterized protein YbjT (DUF2867 family)